MSNQDVAPLSPQSNLKSLHTHISRLTLPRPEHQGKDSPLTDIGTSPPPFDLPPLEEKRSAFKDSYESSELSDLEDDELEAETDKMDFLDDDAPRAHGDNASDLHALSELTELARLQEVDSDDSDSGYSAKMGMLPPPQLNTGASPDLAKRSVDSDVGVLDSKRPRLDDDTLVGDGEAEEGTSATKATPEDANTPDERTEPDSEGVSGETAVKSEPEANGNSDSINTDAAAIEAANAETEEQAEDAESADAEKAANSSSASAGGALDEVLNGANETAYFDASNGAKAAEIAETAETEDLHVDDVLGSENEHNGSVGNAEDETVSGEVETAETAETGIGEVKSEESQNGESAEHSSTEVAEPSAENGAEQKQGNLEEENEENEEENDEENEEEVEDDIEDDMDDTDEQALRQSELGLDPDVDLDEYRRLAVEELVSIETDFAQLRDKLFHDKLGLLEQELQLCLDGSHPELLQIYYKVNEFYQDNIRLANATLNYSLKCINNETVASRTAVHQDFLRNIMDLKNDMVTKTTSLWYKINRERNVLDLTVPDCNFTAMPQFEENPEIPKKTIRHNALVELVHQRNCFNDQLGVLNALGEFHGIPCAVAAPLAQLGNLAASELLLRRATADETAADLQAMQVPP